MAFQNGCFVIDCCLVGLVGVSFDALWLDAVAAVVVALLIAKIALGLLWDSMQELIVRRCRGPIDGDPRNCHECLTSRCSSDTNSNDGWKDPC